MHFSAPLLTFTQGFGWEQLLFIYMSSVGKLPLLQFDNWCTWPCPTFSYEEWSGE